MHRDRSILDAVATSPNSHSLRFDATIAAFGASVQCL